MKNGPLFKKLRIRKCSPPFSGLSFLIRHHVYLQRKQPTQRGRFFCLSRKNSKVAALAIPENLATDTEGERIGLPEGNVAQVSSKQNDHQVKFI